jgi:phosphotransferase system HPr (HPr) family protein
MSMIIEKKVIVQLETGLHARPAAEFVQEAAKYVSEIHIVRGDKEANAKSIMGVMAMAVGKGTEIILRAKGKDAEKAVEALATIVDRVE